MNLIAIYIQLIIIKNKINIIKIIIKVKVNLINHRIFHKMIFKLKIYRIFMKLNKMKMIQLCKFNMIWTKYNSYKS